MKLSKSFKTCSKENNLLTFSLFLDQRTPTHEVLICTSKLESNYHNDDSSHLQPGNFSEEPHMEKQF